MKCLLSSSTPLWSPSFLRISLRMCRSTMSYGKVHSRFFRQLSPLSSLLPPPPLEWSRPQFPLWRIVVGFDFAFSAASHRHQTSSTRLQIPCGDSFTRGVTAQTLTGGSKTKSLGVCRTCIQYSDRPSPRNAGMESLIGRVHRLDLVVILQNVVSQCRNLLRVNARRFGGGCVLTLTAKFDCN